MSHDPLPVLQDEVLLPALPGEVYGIGRLKRIATKFPSEPLEVLGALSIVAIGCWFLLPEVQFPTGFVLTTGQVGQTRTWGLALLAIGLYKWWAVLWGYERRLHRLLAAMLAATAFFVIMMAYIRHASQHVMVVIMGVWLVQQTWIAYRSQRIWHSSR
jgi:hypothetical protein